MTTQPLKAPLLIEGCRAIATFDEKDRELDHADILLDGPQVVEVGQKLREKHQLREDTPAIDARGHVALPGFVNCHHHMYQVLTRSIGRVQNSGLFDWLVEQYQIWMHVDKEAIRFSNMIAMAELILTGTTCSTDHHYLFPESQEVDLIDEQLAVAVELGLRFYPTRGSMTLGVRDGGLPPMELVEADERVLLDYERLAGKYHDRSPLAMTRIGFAPCSPFNVTEQLFRETVGLARKHGVRMHTHLAETDDEDAYCLERYGCRPLDFIARLGWEGNDIWLAHAVKLNDEEIRRMARMGMGVSHCPSSNCRLGSGFAPIVRMLREGVPVGFGVDGSASNDSGNMLAEVRLGMLVHRAVHGSNALTPRDVLRVATRGGAAVLGNPALGKIEAGGPADVVLYNMEQFAYAGGASLDPIAALILCGTSQQVHWSIINGRIVVERGQLARVAERQVVARCNEISARLVDKARERTRINYSVPKLPGYLHDGNG